MMAQDEARQRRTSLDRFLANIPLALSYVILVGSWFGFIFVISIHQVLLKRQETWHFAEQFIIFHMLCGLTILSLFTASTRPPGCPDPSLTPENVIPPEGEKPRSRPRPRSLARLQQYPAPTSPTVQTSERSDDIPLRFLRNANWVNSRMGKDRPSPLPLPSRQSFEPQGDRASAAAPPRRSAKSASPSSGGLDFLAVSPFSLDASPFVPASAVDAGVDYEEEFEERRDSRKLERNGRDTLSALAEENGDPDTNPGDTDRDRLLPGSVRSSIMVKSNTGKPRWCRKCDGWKPDRCHHCRFCRQCTLKMDHHCVWLGTCVGFHNYKPFLLFVTYGMLLAIYGALEAGYESIRFFHDPDDFYATNAEDTSDCAAEGLCDQTTSNVPEIDFAPVIFLGIAISGVFFALAVGSLAGYHWWLACHNMTTLENLTYSYPSVLLSDSQSNDTSGSSSRHGSQMAWKPDHLLTRDERNRLRRDARSINVYDRGWRRNLDSIFGSGPIWKAMWPIARVHDRRDRDAGHFYEHDEDKLERLRMLTRELRVGLKEEDRWYVSESESEEDKEEEEQVEEGEEEGEEEEEEEEEEGEEEEEEAE